MLNKALIIRRSTRSTFSNIQTTSGIKLLCVAKEETMDSTDSALNEIVSSFLPKFLSIYPRIWASVGFFSFRNTLNKSFAEQCESFMYDFRWVREILLTNEEFQGKLSDVEKTIPKYSTVKEHKRFSKQSKWSVSSHVCLKCCRWPAVWSKVISVSMSVVYFVQMKFFQLQFLNPNGMYKNTVGTAGIVSFFQSL